MRKKPQRKSPNVKREEVQIKDIFTFSLLFQLKYFMKVIFHHYNFLVALPSQRFLHPSVFQLQWVSSL